MPNKKSAKKALRKSDKLSAKNTLVKKNIKTLRKNSLKAINNKDAKAQELTKQTIKAIDKAAGKGIMKKNTAARNKSRLQKKLNAATK